MIDYINLSRDLTAIYLNFPFCKLPCEYCHYVDNIKFGFDEIPTNYFETLYKQLEELLKNTENKNLNSIYFGGGTPSLLNDLQLHKLENLFKYYRVKASEVSIEIHPTVCNFDYKNNKFFTRYSIGVQSFSNHILGKYGRCTYDKNKIINMINDIRKSKYSKIINIDLIFDQTLNEEELFYINYIKPETVTFYPNTKGRGARRLRNILITLNNVALKLKGYSPLAKSKFIFIKDSYKSSNYSKIQYEKNGDIIGIGHNSISYIKDITFLCIYDNDNIIFKNRKNKGDRILSSLFMSIFTGVRKDFIQKYMPDVYDSHYLLTVDGDIDVVDKHVNLNDEDLVYLPDKEYIRFYKNICSKYEKIYREIFLSTIGYGDSNYEVIEQVYNREFYTFNDGKLEILDKIKAPRLNILVEGIDGSGKDTFVRFFSNELKKRFLFDVDSNISILGQPDSGCENGVIAKRFIEDLDFNGTALDVENVLKSNRLSSEKKILELSGIVILIRGLVTDKATFNRRFGYIANLGEDKIIKCWDKYIVIDIDPVEADKRISKRGLKRTWREYIKHLKYFREFYINYENDMFNEKIIIKNDNIIELEKKAIKLAEEIYYEYK